MILSSEQVGKAVAWWSNKLRSSEVGLADDTRIDSMLKLASIDDSAPTADQVALFEVALARLITSVDITQLEVDYTPCAILSTAIASSGYQARKPLPIKTRMVFCKGGMVKAKCGRGVELQEVPKVNVELGAKLTKSLK